MEDSDFNESRCVICNSHEHLKRCSRCKTVFYCCREHQKQDWPSHKGSCRPHALPHDENKQAEIGGGVAPVPSVPVETNETLSQQAEIESILDFSNVKLPNEPGAVNEAKSTTNDIFHELSTSEHDDYTGPADDTAAHGNCFNNSTENHSQGDATDTQSQITEDPGGSGDDFTPFDTRPLRKLKFPKPDSYSHKDLAEFIVIRLINLNYCVVDGVFEDEIIDGVINEIKDLKDRNELSTGKLAGGRTSGDNSQKVTETNIRSDVIKWIEGQEEGLSYASQVLARMDSITSFFNLHLRKYGYIQGRTKAMLACYPGNGTYYRRHIDNPSKDGRRITCILYLNKDWDVQKDGGLLRIFPPYDDRPVDIPPLANRLLFFWSDKRNPHEVQPAFRERFAMTVWYFDQEEREKAKVEDMIQETNRINAQIEALEQKKKEMEELTRAQVVQNKAMEAVQSLSPQELQAMSFLIDNHPEPKQVLTSMGISEPIQEALIVYLSAGNQTNT